MVTERLNAALDGRYKIEKQLGQGGMATVYLARDLKHDRMVAVKVLKPELAAVLGAERFVVEIKTTAALQHPHILPLFDSGTADGFLYYVMPYIEGETLRERLNRETQLGIDEAVKITTEVADALDYAHRHGVVHRDIKPENILLHDGRPMVADFGIALAVSAAAGGRMTETGLSLGTPHYMSPEQATADKQITARSDIYSLASVLYEMLSGEPPHMGTSAQQIIMKIIAEPVADVTTRRKTVPPHVAAAVMHALEKLPADRFPSAREFASALANPMYTSGGTSAWAGGVRDARGKRITFALAASLAVVSAVALWLGVRPGTRSPTTRFAVALPAATTLRTTFGASMAVSADGRVLAFAGADSNGGQRLWVKRAGAIDAAPVAGTDDAFSPFLSPDGSQLGFFTVNPNSISVVELAGGRPRQVATSPLGVGGAYWASDGYIYFDSNQQGIDRVRPDGSGRENVASLDTARRVTGYAWPEVLPGNRILIVRLRHFTDEPDDYSIVAIPIGGGPVVTLTNGVAARHLDGHLLVVRADGVMIARRLMNGGRGLDSATTIVATDVRVQRGPYFGAADVATDRNGSLYYVNATTSAGSGLRVSWLSRGGSLSAADSAGSLNELDDSYAAPGLRRMLLWFTNDSARLWVRELPSGTLTPFVHPPGATRGTAWNPAGDSLILALSVERGTEFRQMRADGLGSAEVIARDTGRVGWYISVSPDGRWIVAQRAEPGRPSREVVVLDRQRDSVFRTLISAATPLGQPNLSPDGKWLAYTSARSSRNEVYVQPFPNVNGGITQVSVDGGEDPKWSPGGDRLYYLRLNGPDAIVAADVGKGPTFSASTPRVIFTQDQLEGLELGRGWSVGPGDRLLVLSRVARYSRPQLVRIENATGLLKGGLR